MRTSLIARSQEQLALLNCRRLPGRIGATETALLLGFQDHDIAALVSGKLLAPLGRPAPNAPKYFATVDVLALSQDREWLAQATKTISKHWSRKNAKEEVRGSAVASEHREVAA